MIIELDVFIFMVLVDEENNGAAAENYLFRKKLGPKTSNRKWCGGRDLNPGHNVGNVVY